MKLVSSRLALRSPESFMTTLSLSQFLPYRLSILSNRLSDAISGACRARFGL